jgi:hypothetical protein
MDWNNIVVILLYVIIAKWILGAGYGIYLLHKRIPFTWQATFIVGPAFWIGYGAGRGAKLITNKIKGVS